MQDNKWARLLAYVTGLVNQGLLLQCEYLVAENRILRSHVSGRLRLSDPERSTLAEIAQRLGRQHLAQVACIARPDTILACYRRLIARKFDGSKHRSYPGRAGTQITGWRPRSRMPRHPHSIREWNPPISVRPSSRIAVIASNVSKINPPGHWDEQRKPVLLPSRIRSGPAAYRCCPAQKAHRPAEVDWHRMCHSC